MHLMATTIVMATPRVATTGTAMAEANRTLRASSTAHERPVESAECAGGVTHPFLGGWPMSGVDDDLCIAGVEAVTGPALQRLLAWLSPSFPVGAYCYSHGLEWAVEDGSVTD